MSEYKPSFLVDKFHSLPHLDLTFRPVNSTFAPEILTYRESLIFWLSLPILWLLFTLLIFLVYFCFRCCQNDIGKDDNKPCVRWFIVILAFISCCVLGVGCYGNETVRRGLSRAVDSTKDFNDRLIHVQNNINLLRTRAEFVRVEARSDNIDRQLRDCQAAKQLRVSADKLLTSVLTQAMAVEGQLFKCHSSHQCGAQYAANLLDDYSLYWWVGVGAILAWSMCHTILLMCGVCAQSKCTLLLFCTLGIFTLVMAWASVGIFLAGGVAAGDFCAKPRDYIEKESSALGIDRDVVNSFAKCTIQDSIFAKQFDEVDNDVLVTMEAVISVTTATDCVPNMDALAVVTNATTDVRASAMQLRSLLTCTRFHGDYTDAIQGLCDISMWGLVVLLVAMVTYGLLFTVLIIVASKAWSHFSEKGASDGEEEEAFIGRPDVNTLPVCYSYHGLPPNRRGPHERLPMQHRYAPPPAYNGVEFYRTYADTTHSSDDRSDMM